MIEWGDMAEPVLPADFLEIRLEYLDGTGDDSADDARRLVLRPVGPGWANRSAALAKALERWVVPA